MRNIIGISGYAGSGKDTVAHHLSGVFEDTHHVAFADGVREMVMRINPMVVSPLRNALTGNLAPYNELLMEFGYEWVKKYTNARDTLVAVGAGAREILGEDVWVDSLFKKHPEGNLIISDVRYASEAKRIQELGGVVWLITRPGYKPATTEEARTIPEVSLIANRIIRNDGSIIDLLETAFQISKRYYGITS